MIHRDTSSEGEPGLVSGRSFEQRWFDDFCLLVVFSFSSLLGCDETLPSRDEPEEYLQTQFYVEAGTVILRDTVAEGGAGSFVLRVKNVYEEVLQDSAHVEARVEVWLKGNPDQKAIVVAKINSLVNNTIVRYGVLTLPVNVEAFIEKQWKHQTDSQIPFWRFVPVRHLVNSRGERYLESNPVSFVAKATVQLFKQRGIQRTGEVEFSLVYHVFGVE